MPVESFVFIERHALDTNGVSASLSCFLLYLINKIYILIATRAIIQKMTS